MPHKILSIDDSKTIRMIVSRTLKHHDCIVCEASNGEEGLAIAAAERPDVILLDATMPIMDGATTLAKLRENAALKDTPVILLTAEASRENSPIGVRDCLSKPFKESQLIEKLGQIIPLALNAVA